MTPAGSSQPPGTPSDELVNCWGSEEAELRWRRKRCAWLEGELEQVRAERDRAFDKLGWGREHRAMEDL